MKRLYVIIDWQDEEDIQVVKNPNSETFRAERLDDATQMMIVIGHANNNQYLKVVEI